MRIWLILPFCMNMFSIRLFSIGIKIGRGTCLVLTAVVYVLMTGVLRADTHYVDANRPDDSGDGLSWATAVKTIQTAITASAANIQGNATFDGF